MNHKTENQGKLKIIFQKITGVPYIDTVWNSNTGNTKLWWYQSDYWQPLYGTNKGAT